MTLSSGKNEPFWPSGNPMSGLNQYQPWSAMSLSCIEICVASPTSPNGVPGTHSHSRSDHAPTRNARTAAAAAQSASAGQRLRAGAVGVATGEWAAVGFSIVDPAVMGLDYCPSVPAFERPWGNARGVTV